MVITESELRELWRDGRSPLPAFAPGTRFSPSAQEFLKEHQLEIVFLTPAELLAQLSQPPSPSPIPTTPPPAEILAARLASLHALTLLVAAEARRFQLPGLAARLETLAGQCEAIRAAVLAARLETLAGQREALRAAVLAGQALAPLPPAGATGPSPSSLTSSAEYQAVPGDHAILHWLSYLRAQLREAALLADPNAWPAPTATASSAALAAPAATALRHVEHAVADLQQLVVNGQLGWRAGPE